MLSSLFSKLTFGCSVGTSAGQPALSAPLSEPKAPASANSIKSNLSNGAAATLQQPVMMQQQQQQQSQQLATARVAANQVEKEIKEKKQKLDLRMANHIHNQKLFGPHLQNIVKQSGFPPQFWAAIANRTDIAYTGSSVVSTILGAKWQNQDKDIFVSTTVGSIDAVWSLLGMLNYRNTFSTGNQPSPGRYGQLTEQTGIVQSQKRVRQDGQIINVIMVDTKGMSIPDYALAYFDLEICATCTNGTEIWVPDANDFVLRRTHAKADAKPERIAKYDARGIKVFQAMKKNN